MSVEPVEVVVGELLPAAGETAPAVVGEHQAAAAVLASMDQAAQEHLRAIRPDKTRSGYARDWRLWCEFLAYLAEQTGQRLPVTSFTVGTMVGFVTWLDQVHQAAPTTIDRRLAGVAVTARQEHGIEIPKSVKEAARGALKPLKLDEERRRRGRGKAPAAFPEHLRRMAAADPAPRGGRKKRGPHPLAVLRNRALVLMAWAIAGRSAEVAALDTDGIQPCPTGLLVHVPSVKGRPARDVVVAYGTTPQACPVRAWQEWKEAAGLEDGPAFRAVSESGRVSGRRLTADSCRIVFTRTAEWAGIEVRMTGHSARAGFITTASMAGKREEEIRAQSGHAPGSAVFSEYVRIGNQLRDAVGDGLL